MRPLCGVLAFLLLTISGHAQDPSPTGNSSISGRILTSQSEPIAGATVLLGMMDGSSPLFWWNTTSDANGRYEFMDLPAGQFRVYAGKESYAGWRSIPSAAPAPMVAGRPIPAMALSRVPRLTIELVPGGRAVETNLTLFRPAMIAGRIFASDGRLNPEASIRLYLMNADAIAGFANHRADFLGHFSINDLEPGEYRIGAADALPNNVNLAALDVSALTGISLREGGEVRNIDISTGTVPGFSLTGRVVDSTGQVPRAVQLEYGVPGATHRGLLSTVAPDGRFQIRDREITAGPLTVLARGEDDNGPVIGLMTVTVIDGPNDLEIVVGKPGGLRGRVTIEGGVPVAAARLALVREGFTPLGAGDDVIEVAPDGWVEATGLIGDYRVRVDEPQRWTVKAVRRRSVRTVNDRLTIRNAETLDDLEIVIGPR